MFMETAFHLVERLLALYLYSTWSSHVLILYICSFFFSNFVSNTETVFSHCFFACNFHQVPLESLRKEASADGAEPPTPVVDRRPSAEPYAPPPYTAPQASAPTAAAVNESRSLQQRIPSSSSSSTTTSSTAAAAAAAAVAAPAVYSAPPRSGGDEGAAAAAAFASRPRVVDDRPSPRVADDRPRVPVDLRSPAPAPPRDPRVPLDRDPPTHATVRMDKAPIPMGALMAANAVSDSRSDRVVVSRRGSGGNGGGGGGGGSSVDVRAPRAAAAVTPIAGGGGDDGVSGASRGTPVIPAQRDKPVGLDMEAFLPPNAADFAEVRGGVGDAEILESIETGHASMIRVLTARLRNTQIVRARWEGGDARAAVDTLITLADQVITRFFCCCSGRVD